MLRLSFAPTAAKNSGTDRNDLLLHAAQDYLAAKSPDNAARALGLTKREQQIVALRFGEDLSQHEIASRVGLSQMHVSRLLRGALDRMQPILAQSL